LLEEQYRDFLSGFHYWEQLKHADDWIVFPENIGEYLAIDETSLSQGELYTVITNKSAKGCKGALIAMVKGTQSERVIEILNRIPKKNRRKVKEITLDMAPTMARIAKISFPKAKQVIDRFHLQQLASEAVQEIRIKHRWEALEQENNEQELARQVKQKYIPDILENGDTLKQLLARSRYLLYKSDAKWTPSQHRRAELLFARYPDIKEAYDLSMGLSRIYSSTKDKGIALTRLAQWYRKVEETGFKSFNTICKTITENTEGIFNYFDNRSTNAAAESFNAKIKSFRSLFRGVRNVSFFLFRLANIYA